MKKDNQPSLENEKQGTTSKQTEKLQSDSHMDGMFIEKDRAESFEQAFKQTIKKP